MEFKAVLIEKLNESKSIKDINETLVMLRNTNFSTRDSSSEYSYLNPFLDKLLGYWPKDVSTTKIYRNEKYKYIEDYAKRESSNRRYLEYLITTLLDSSFDKLAELKLIGEEGEKVYIEKKVEVTKWSTYDLGNNRIVIQPWETKTHFRNTNILGRLEPFKKKVFRSLEEYTAEVNGFYNIDSLKFFSDIVEQLAGEFNTCNIDVELMSYIIRDTIAESIKKITVMSSYEDESGESVDHSRVNNTYNLINLIRSLEHFIPAYHAKHMTTNQEYAKDIEDIDNRYKDRQLTRLDVCMHEKEYVERSIKYLEKYTEEDHETLWDLKNLQETVYLENKVLDNTATPLEKEFVSVYRENHTRQLIRSLIFVLRCYLTSEKSINDRIQFYKTTSYKKPFNFFTKYISSKEARKEVDKCRDKDQTKDKELAKSSSKRPDRSSSNSSASVRR